MKHLEGDESKYKHIGSLQKTKVGPMERDTMINNNMCNHGTNFPADLPIPAKTPSWRTDF